ncbi:MAG: hypothetical protein AAB401_17560, partial [Acidobacteriota bacterium]
RLAEALQTNGWQTRLTTLQAIAADADGESFDWVFLVNIYELIHSHPGGGSLLAALRKRSRRLIQVLLECVTTNWFADSFWLGKRVGADWLFDFGLQDQTAQASEPVRRQYRFVFNGLTASERQTVALLDEHQARRIPWAFVGHQTGARVELAYRLVRDFDPSGFFYLPELSPVTEDGPHLNEEQFLQVLKRARYQIWASHHQGFYLEGERFRASLLTGSVPLKVMLNTVAPADDLPFSYLLLGESEFVERLNAMEFDSIRRRFVADFARLPGLAESLSEVINSLD